MHYYQQSIAQIAKQLQVDVSLGMTEKSVTKKREDVGKNELPTSRHKVTKLKLIISQFKSALMIILIVAGVISGLLGELLDMVVILITALFNAVIGYVQENKASEALDKLSQMITYKVLVLRDGKKELIRSTQIVPGDVLILEAGDKIQADARILECHECSANESALTGESEPVRKSEKNIAKLVPVGDRSNMLHSGTILQSGTAKAVVVATGVDTEIGKIATLVKDTPDEATPLQLQLRKLSKSLGIVVVFISAGVFAIGILFSQGGTHAFVQMFETAIAIAVAAIPEGLAISLTVILAIGMRFILKRKALVRKLVAAETLGSVSVICTDKTGTITEGKMRVTHMITGSEILDKTDIEHLSPERKDSHRDALLALHVGVLANDGAIERKGDDPSSWTYIGDTTDIALIDAGVHAEMEKFHLDSANPRLDVIPFSSSRKYMATLHRTGQDNSVYVKGAPEKILDACTHVEVNGKRTKLTPAKKKEWHEKMDTFTSRGLRLLGIAYKDVKNKQKIEEADINDLTFVAVAALSDPLRSDVRETLKIAKRAGIKITMITGDHVKTAGAIGRQIGLDDGKIFDGAALEHMSDEELRSQVTHVSIFARVDPVHKIRIVRAFQSLGEVVAMTGDGVNDAPALKGADIGVALGSGTDVAKETADMVLLDDSFSTIVASIEEGRTIYQNIKKVVLYLLSGSFAEVILITGSIIGGFPIAALPAQILWINLVEDAFPNIALAFDKGDKENMKDKPRKKSEKLIDREMKIMIILKSIVANVILFALFVWYYTSTGDIDKTRTIVFVGFGIDALFYIFSIRSLRHMVWQYNPFSNKYLLLAVGFGWLMLIAAVHTPPLQTLLRTVPLTLTDWGIMITFGLSNVILIETVKGLFLVRAHRKRTLPIHA